MPQAIKSEWQTRLQDDGTEVMAFHISNLTPAQAGTLRGVLPDVLTAEIRALLNPPVKPAVPPVDGSPASIDAAHQLGAALMAAYRRTIEQEPHLHPLDALDAFSVATGTILKTHLKDRMMHTVLAFLGRVSDVVMSTIYEAPVPPRGDPVDVRDRSKDN